MIAQNSIKTVCICGSKTLQNGRVRIGVFFFPMFLTSWLSQMIFRTSKLGQDKSADALILPHSVSGTGLVPATSELAADTGTCLGS